jgi:hypothetical protein
MKYLAHLTQEEGCDYTIGCGIAIIELKSKTMEDAIQELRSLIKESYSGERQLEKAIIYAVDYEIKLNLDLIYLQLVDDNKMIEQQKLEIKEKEELERLKKKYENN